MEPLPAFVSRLACSHGSDLWDFQRFNGINPRRLKKEEIYRRLSGMTGVGEDVLAHHDFVKVGGSDRIFGVVIDKQDIFAKAARVCARCVQEDMSRGSGRMEARPHLRFPWMLRTLGCCATHGTRLRVIGPDYHRYVYGDFSNQIARYQAEVEQAATEEPNAACDATRYFFEIFAEAADRKNGAEDGSEMLSPRDLLRDIPPPAALLVTEIVGGMVNHGSNYRRYQASAEERQEAVRAGFATTSQGYEGLRLFLHTLDLKLGSYVRSGRFKNLYGSFQDFLRYRIEDPCYWPVVDFVVRHAVETHPLGPKDNFLGFKGSRKVHSIRTAELEYRIHRATIRKLLRSAGLLPTELNARTDGRVLIDAETLHGLIHKWQARVPIEHAKSRLGISVTALARIVDSGLMDLTDEERQKGLSRKTLEAFMQKLSDAKIELPVAGMKPMLNVAQSTGLTYAKIIGLIFSGAVKNIAIAAEAGDEFGFKNIYVDPDEIFAASTRRGEPPGLSFKVAERVIGTTTQTTKQLVFERVIESFQGVNPANGRLQTYIAPEAIATFQATYVSLREYSRGRGNIAQIKRRLDELGVVPVLQGTGIATIYRRADLGK